MRPPALLRVDRLELHNFRCFAECTLELHPQLTVLVAVNGHGKTAVLDALGVALGPFVETIAPTRHVRAFDRSDVRLVREQDGTMAAALPSKFVADGYVGGQEIHWSRALNGNGLRSRPTNKDAKDLRQAAQRLRASASGDARLQNATPAILPLVASYGTGRLWSEHRPSERKGKYAKSADGRMSGYDGCLSSSSSFKGMVAWYENKMNETRDPRFKGELSNNLPLLAAVHEATRAVLAPTGWCELDWDFAQRYLVVGHPDYGRLPLSVLSDGVRNMIALIADIARRCANLNPHLSDAAAQLTPGVLLIDEVDMHLHPRWQQLVVDLLQQAFPEMQMILSTHSPHVLSTVDKDSIRVIRLNNGQGVPEVPAFQTRGVESADILAKVMDVNPSPQVEQAIWLTDYRAFVQTGEYESEAARELWGKLLAHFGAEHPVLAEVDTLRRLQEFKRANRLPLQGGN